jgi:hypothetical protein
LGLALYLARVRSSDLLGISPSITSADLLPVYWFFCGVRLDDAKRYIVTDLNPGVHPLKYFLRAWLDRSYACALDATGRHIGRSRACYSNERGQLSQITGATCDLELAIYADFHD